MQHMSVTFVRLQTSAWLTHSQILQKKERQTDEGDEGDTLAAGRVPQLLKVSRVKISSEIKRMGLDARIVGYINDSMWVEVPEVR
jgi:hypothetical protein